MESLFEPLQVLALFVERAAAGGRFAGRRGGETRGGESAQCGHAMLCAYGAVAFAQARGPFVLDRAQLYRRTGIENGFPDTFNGGVD